MFNLPPVQYSDLPRYLAGIITVPDELFPKFMHLLMEQTQDVQIYLLQSTDTEQEILFALDYGDRWSSLLFFWLNDLMETYTFDFDQSEALYKAIVQWDKQNAEFYEEHENGL